MGRDNLDDFRKLVLEDKLVEQRDDANLGGSDGKLLPGALVYEVPESADAVVGSGNRFGSSSLIVMFFGKELRSFREEIFVCV